MPRQARLDISGLLQHVIVRRIEGGKYFLTTQTDASLANDCPINGGNRFRLFCLGLDSQSFQSTAPPQSTRIKAVYAPPVYRIYLQLQYST